MSCRWAANAPFASILPATQKEVAVFDLMRVDHSRYGSAETAAKSHQRTFSGAKMSSSRHVTLPTQRASLVHHERQWSAQTARDPCLVPRALCPVRFPQEREAAKRVTASATTPSPDYATTARCSPVVQSDAARGVVAV